MPAWLGTPGRGANPQLTPALQAHRGDVGRRRARIAMLPTSIVASIALEPLEPLEPSKKLRSFKNDASALNVCW